jgi:hypothetical protein
MEKKKKNPSRTSWTSPIGQLNRPNRAAFSPLPLTCAWAPPAGGAFFHLWSRACSAPSVEPDPAPPAEPDPPRPRAFHSLPPFPPSINGVADTIKGRVMENASRPFLSLAAKPFPLPLFPYKGQATPLLLSPPLAKALLSLAVASCPTASSELVTAPEPRRTRWAVPCSSSRHAGAPPDAKTPLPRSLLGRTHCQAPCAHKLAQGRRSTFYILAPALE